MCAPKPPPPPDYKGAAIEQGAANKESAIASAKLNNPNVISPLGTQTVTYGGADGLIPTITQTLSPEQQSLLNKSNQTKSLLGDLGIQGASALQSVIGRNLDLSGVPASPGGAEQTRQNVINAMMSRADEDYGRQREQANSDLVAAGIRPGTKAYADRMQMIERSRNDARSQAELAAGAEAERDFGMDADRRRVAIAEILAQRQTPLNEINALMSGSQVSNPFAMPGAAQNSNIAPAPLFGATQAQGQADMNLYNQQVASRNSMMNGLFSLGGSGMMAYAMSDRRLKSNIRRIGTHPLGVGIYEYDIFNHREIGVMAQELMQVKPDAVAVHPSGYLMVNYGAI